MEDISGLGPNITEELLRASTKLLVYICLTVRELLLIQDSHNSFPPDTPFPEVDVFSDGVNDLCALIAKYKAQNDVRLRLLHRHVKIPEGSVLLGKSTTELPGYWTAPTAISDIDIKNIYGYIFSADCTTDQGERRPGLFPSEFREGPLVCLDIDDGFFTEFANCALKLGLAETLGLEVVRGQTGKTIEFSFDTGSLLLQEEDVSAKVVEMGEQFTLQETGWAVSVKDGIVLKTGETRCCTLPTGHIKITNTKIKGVKDTLDMLKGKGILAI